MRRRRGTTDAFRFDLETADERNPVARLAPKLGQADADVPRLTSLLERVRAWPRRRVVAALAMVAAVVAGAWISLSVQEGRRAEALRTAPGGVFDLSRPPEPTWTTELTNGTPVVALGDALVLVEVQGDGFTSGQVDSTGRAADTTTVVRAVELEDGNESWRRTLDGRWTCGPAPRGHIETLLLSITESLVCVEATEAANVEVLDEHGEAVARRALPPSDELRVPAADAGLLRFETVGEPGPLPDLVADGASGWRTDGQIIAPDVRVTMEDAATGAVRWQATAHSVPVFEDGLDRCVTWESDDGGMPRINLDIRNYSASVDKAIVTVSGCGIEAAFTPSGMRLDPVSWGYAQQGKLASGPSVRTTVDGRYVRPHDLDWRGRYSLSPGATWDLLDADGSPVAELPGMPTEPLASDGVHAGTVLIRKGSDNHLSAVRAAEGTELWSTKGSMLGEVVRTGDQTLVATARNQLVGLDLETGRERWATNLGADERSSSRDLHSVVRAAYTDGRVAVVVTPPSGDPDPVWTAYDLATGEVTWTREPNLGDGVGIAVAGHLMFWDYQTLTGLG